MGIQGRASLSSYKVFFVTTTVYDFIHVFDLPAAADLLISNIRHYQHKYKFTILAYVIMPSHFHWIIEIDPELGTISAIMRDIKKYSAWDILDYLKNNNPDLARRFEITNEFQKRKLWMDRFDDEVIRNEKMLFTKIKYIHNNPVKAGLTNSVYGYKYSSASDYYQVRKSVLDVNVKLVGIEMI